MSIGNSWINAEQLKKLYIDECLSTYKIAEQFNISSPTVRYWLIKWGFELRGKSEAQMGESNPGWVGGREKHYSILMRKFFKEYKLSRGCKICGYNRSFSALDFHHRNPSEKSFNVTRGYSKDFKLLQEEVNKCDLLCSNCHNEFHDKNYSYDHYGNGPFRKMVEWVDDIKLVGCQKCFYKKCSAALEFHHKNDDKLFTIGRKFTLQYKTKEEIYIEIRKCFLLCSNCHRELQHDSIVRCENDWKQFLAMNPVLSSLNEVGF